jgi:hypothetical protein
MLSILSAVLGFATSGLPSVLDFFKQKGDQKHEQSMARLDMERALALAEKGYASEGASPWVLNLRASVRPVITYIFVFIVLFIDIVGLIWAIKSGVDFVTALEIIFSDEEMAIFASIIGFWFGSRHWDRHR